MLIIYYMAPSDDAHDSLSVGPTPLHPIVQQDTLHRSLLSRISHESLPNLLPTRCSTHAQVPHPLQHADDAHHDPRLRRPEKIHAHMHICVRLLMVLTCPQSVAPCVPSTAVLALPAVPHSAVVSPPFSVSPNAQTLQRSPHGMASGSKDEEVRCACELMQGSCSMACYVASFRRWHSCPSRVQIISSCGLRQGERRIGWRLGLVCSDGRPLEFCPVAEA